MLSNVAFLHAGLVTVLVAALATFDAPIFGAMFGGSAIALFYGAFWGAVTALSRRGRRLSVWLLVLLKILGYPVLAFAAFQSGQEFDGAGFAAGVSCFLLAASLAPFLRRFV